MRNIQYGYGIAKSGDKLAADLTETIKICQMLYEKGIEPTGKFEEFSYEARKEDIHRCPLTIL